MTVDIAPARRNLQARFEGEHAEREARRAAAERAVTEAVLHVVADFPGVQRVFLFGSVTRENAFRSDSDVAIEGLGVADSASTHNPNKKAATPGTWPLLISARLIYAGMPGEGGAPPAIFFPVI